MYEFMQVKIFDFLIYSDFYQVSEVKDRACLSTVIITLLRSSAASGRNLERLNQKGEPEEGQYGAKAEK